MPRSPDSSWLRASRWGSHGTPVPARWRSSSAWRSWPPSLVLFLHMRLTDAWRRKERARVSVKGGHMGQDFGNFIGGAWVDSAAGDTFENLNPADRREVIGTFARSGAEDVDRAVRAAAAAYPEWMRTPAPERSDYLLRVALLLEERKEELSKTMTREMGKTLKESRGDIQEGIDFAHYMAGEGRRLFGETMPSELRNKFYMTVRHPIGPVALITPWNFPIAIPLWKICPAIVSGCTMVFKPAEDTPLCAALLVGARFKERSDHHAGRRVGSRGGSSCVGRIRHVRTEVYRDFSTHRPRRDQGRLHGRAARPRGHHEGGQRTRSGGRARAGDQ